MDNKYKRRSYIIRVLFFEVLFLGMFFYTALNLNHITNFSVVFKNYNGFIKNITVYIYFITLDFLLAYYTIQTIYIMVKGKDGWYNKLTKVDSKLNIFEFVFKCFAILLFGMYYIATPCTVSGRSMEPTFKEGENLLTLNTYWSLEKNDVVIFNASKYSNDESLYIKRIIAKKGDVITYVESTGLLYVNDEVVKDTSGNQQEITSREYQVIRLSLSYNLTEIYDYDKKVKSHFVDELFDNLSNKYSYKIDTDKYIVFGDNRNNSYDSRSFGAINQQDIYGKVWLRFYPFETWRFF